MSLAGAEPREEKKQSTLHPAAMRRQLSLSALPAVRPQSQYQSNYSEEPRRHSNLRERYRAFHGHFGNDEVVLIEVHDERGVLGPEMLPKLDELARKVREVDGIARVHSLLTTKHALGVHQKAVCEGYLKKKPRKTLHLGRWKKRWCVVHNYPPSLFWRCVPDIMLESTSHSKRSAALNSREL